MTQLFNVAGLFVIFRETLEASIIIAVLLQFVNRTIKDEKKQAQLRKQVWIGAFIGIILSLLIGAGIIVAFHVLGQNVFSGTTEPLWEGCLMLLAVVLLTWLSFRMIEINMIMSKWEMKIQSAAEKTSLTNDYSLGLLSFTIIIREGVEAVIFVSGVSTADPISMILPALVGIGLGVFCGLLLYRGSSKLNLSLFFKVSSALLLIIAAGLAASAAHEFEEYHFENINSTLPEGEEGPESTRVLWDVSACCSQNTNGFFQIMNALVGWRSVATVATVSTYFTYWALVLVLFSLDYMIKRNKQKNSNSIESPDNDDNDEKDKELKDATSLDTLQTICSPVPQMEMITEQETQDKK